jgi:hypothetical protein
VRGVVGAAGELVAEALEADAEVVLGSAGYWYVAAR